MAALVGEAAFRDGSEVLPLGARRDHRLPWDGGETGNLTLRKGASWGA